MSELRIVLPRFGDDGVGSEDPHAIEGSLGLVLGRQLAADHTEFSQRSLCLHFALKLSLLFHKSPKRKRKRKSRI